MTAETNSTQVENDAFPPTNPYTNAITWIWVGAFVIAVILALMGLDAADNFDPEGAAVRFFWAGLLGGVGTSTLMTWLVVKALLWKAPVSFTE